MWKCDFSTAVCDVCAGQLVRRAHTVRQIQDLHLMTKDKVNQTIFTHKFVLVRPEKLNDCNTKTCTRNHVEFFLHFL